ncbi:DUF5712 family protein [Tunicatimonas pelagia]|uniref:DUF5712 family protein n=1 Tax=Tunicatimonas pelagia TaxID=931531 RepID=UPI002664FC16|nr:DUF5712 family protein [Tunicatimonas pelagia]WKN43281.1 DUF5712 family protein [Tunicatimonas pelagia]
MHTKIIDPKRDGRLVFANRGSCQKTVSYLGHDAKARDETVQFFDQERNAIAPEEVKSMIDRNAKGLRKEQEKFYSLVISPSQAELVHLKNDPTKLQEYTRAVMQNYAKNFNLKDDSRIRPSELVWYATIHHDRTEKEGEQKGEVKKGHHTHVHILMRAQDRNRQHHLNPKGWKSHFTFKDWQVQNGRTFQQLFDYQQETTSKNLTASMPEATQLRHQERIRYKIDYLNQYFTGHWKLDENKVLSIAGEQNYGKGFFFRLHHLTKSYQQGKLVNSPYLLLETGKDELLALPEHTLLHLGKQSLGMSEEVAHTDAEKQKKKQ